MIDFNAIKTLAQRVQGIEYAPVDVGGSGVAWTVSDEQASDIDELAESTLALVAEVERLRAHGVDVQTSGEVGNG